MMLIDGPGSPYPDHPVLVPLMPTGWSGRSQNRIQTELEAG